jgi:Questin oxidase-like
VNTVEDLLDAYQRLHRLGPEYDADEEGNHGNTNHGPMAAEVIVRRGLDIQIDSWLDNYERRLDELPAPAERVTAETWRVALGDHRRITDWATYFGEELSESPWQEVLTTWWPRLLSGIAAGSTHGVIRVGHAVRTLMVADHQVAHHELAHGLAFWAARWRPIAGAEVHGTLAPAQALDQLPSLPLQSGYIADRITRLEIMPQWPAAVSRLAVSHHPSEVRSTLADLVDAATTRYLTVGRRAPVLLVHTATAPNAVLHCLPALPDQLWRSSLAAVWTSVAALTTMYASAPDPSPVSLTGHDVVGNLFDRASTHRDEHVIKFADTAAETFARTSNPEAIAAGHLAADLILPASP